jgi:hypothetical protein
VINRHYINNDHGSSNPTAVRIRSHTMSPRSSRVAYQAIPTDDIDDDNKPSHFPLLHNKKAVFLRRILTVLAILYATMMGLRYLGRTGRLPWSSPVCRGVHRNVSTGAGLPSHYVLPSGDKIPSVALGKCVCYVSGLIVDGLSCARIQAFGRPMGDKWGQL